ncbi:MAG: magnesium chelatase [Pseudopedobacter saltans]|uniref:Magnesium chelatase n=1 Tax=Pseudopedobacter saltans TaxID=151895 RepID=A0A2W5F821_9SPHI|nr:MAG: magnesium chelatase [Pseudopedobacter saltans]
MENSIQLDTLTQAVEQIKSNIGKVIVGQEKMVELLVTALLAKGHVLIEGVPGVAKTLTAKLLAKSIDVPFSRIQFTPDLMPTDIIGTSVFLPQEGSFKFKHGPIFSQVVLIDEINRSPAKTQAALFEVMEERQISYDGTTYPMQNPFFVLATQNPIEQEGTYRLPEAQLDRFLFKIDVGYPTLEEEVNILQKSQSGITTDLSAVTSVLSAQQVIEAQKIVQQIHIEEKVLQYIASLIYATRNNKSLYLGASPRASVAVLNSSKAIAAMRGRDFVTPDDIVYVLPSVLGHRIILTPEKEMEGGTPAQVIKDIVNKVEVPR